MTRGAKCVASFVAVGDGEALVRAADTALFAAKSRGRDRVVAFDSPASPSAEVA